MGEEKVDTLSKGMGVASLVFGILSIVFMLFIYMSIIFATLAIIFGIISTKKQGKGMAVAGLVLGIITLSLWAVIMVLGVAGLGIMSQSGMPFEEIVRELESSSSYRY